MTLTANKRVKQSIIVQLAIGTFFAVSLLNMVSKGYAVVGYFPCLICVIALVLCVISCMGLSSYYNNYYIKVEKDNLYYSGFTFKKPCVDMNNLGGYMLQNGNLTLISKKGKFVCEVRSCYLLAEDFEALILYVSKYTQQVYPQKRKSIFQRFVGLR